MSNWCVFVMPQVALLQKVRCLILGRSVRGTGRNLGRGGATLFLALEEGVNLLPGFSPELQGVYSETDADGIKRLYGYVVK